jgi:hypothetical protein
MELWDLGEVPPEIPAGYRRRGSEAGEGSDDKWRVTRAGEVCKIVAESVACAGHRRKQEEQK